MTTSYIDLPAGHAERRAWLRQTIVGAVMLPLSMLPFWLYVSHTAEGRLLARRAEITLAEPTLPHLPSGAASWIVDNAPRYDGGVAVLVYHGIGVGSEDGEGGQTLTADQFGEQLAALRLADLTPITASQFAAACTGEAELPDNAVMITFDDGRSEAIMFADPLLRQADMTATMFVISGSSETPGLFYVGWEDLVDYAASGRWDLQGHTAALHNTLPGSELQSPLLVNRLEDETLAQWRTRVTDDLDLADQMLATEVGVPDPVAFAYPFGAHGGDDRTNDERIAGELRTILEHRYTLAFHQDDQDDVPLATCEQDRLGLRRLDARPWSGRQLIAQLNAMVTRS